jgi:hypothetical protein
VGETSERPYIVNVTAINEFAINWTHVGPPDYVQLSHMLNATVEDGSYVYERVEKDEVQVEIERTVWYFFEFLQVFDRISLQIIPGILFAGDIHKHSITADNLQRGLSDEKEAVLSQHWLDHGLRTVGDDYFGVVHRLLHVCHVLVDDIQCAILAT